MLATVQMFTHRRWIPATLVIAAVVAITYSQALHIGFWTDDYLHIDLAGRFDGADFLSRAFDPRMQVFWYRPMVGIQWKVESALFHGDPMGYHLVQIVYHFINSMLLFAVTTRVTAKWRVGFVAGLLFATLALPSMTVYWPAVHDPLAGVFALAASWWWLDFLETNRRGKAVLASIAFIGAMLSKEITIVLPALFFLADRLLVAKSISVSGLFRRYASFLFIAIGYALLQMIVITQSVFTQRIGYGASEQMISVFLYFASLLALPWEVNQTLRYAWLVAVALVLLLFAIKRDRRLMFLAAVAVLPTIILIPIPSHLTNPRYLYLPLFSTVVGYALLFDVMIGVLEKMRLAWMRAGMWLILAAVIFSGSLTISEHVENYAGFTRQMRILFRPIYRAHPTFAPGTFLYFLDTPLQTLDISGLMFLRYGTNVTVSGVDQGVVGSLRVHKTAIVWYLDEHGQFQEQTVAAKTNAQIAPPLPVQFGESIRLDALEIVTDHVKRNEAIVVLVRWQANGRISKNYTTFAHLVDEGGKIVAGIDSQPRKGLAPTTSWRAGSLVADGFVIPITDEVVPGTKYRLEIGWYYLPTMERLFIIDESGRPITDMVIIEPFSVE